MRKNNDYYFDKYVEAMCKMAENEVVEEMRKKLDVAIEKVGLLPEQARQIRELMWATN